jgi:hypothetical protein
MANKYYPSALLPTFIYTCICFAIGTLAILQSGGSVLSIPMILVLPVAAGIGFFQRSKSAYIEIENGEVRGWNGKVLGDERISIPLSSVDIGKTQALSWLDRVRFQRRIMSKDGLAIFVPMMSKKQWSEILTMIGQ